MPSAWPKPVIERIMRSAMKRSCRSASTASVPELPSHPVHLHGRRHRDATNLLVRPAGEVAVLVEKRGALEAEFEQSGHDVGTLGDPDIRGAAAGGRTVKERRAVAQLVPEARVDRKLTSWEPPAPIADERDLRAHVQLRAIELRCVPTDRLHIEAHVLVQPSGSRHEDPLRSSRRQDCRWSTKDHRRLEPVGVIANDTAAEPQSTDFERRLGSERTAI